MKDCDIVLSVFYLPKLGRKNHGPPVSRKFMTPPSFHGRLMLNFWIQLGEGGAMTSAAQLRIVGTSSTNL